MKKMKKGAPSPIYLARMDKLAEVLKSAGAAVEGQTTIFPKGPGTHAGQ